MKMAVTSGTVIALVALAALGCVHAIKDETNFTGPELRTYSTIVVRPFASGRSRIDTYFAEALNEYWPAVVVIPPETVLTKFDSEDIKSFGEAHYSTKDVGEAFGADAVAWAVISTHAFAPYYDANARRIVHLTTYLVDLNTHDTVACYHSEGSILVHATDAEYRAEQNRRMAAANVRGLLELAKASGHL